MSSYYIVKPPVESTPTPVYDYGTVYSAISTALSNIDADTTPMAATLALIATSLATIATNSSTVATNLTAISSTLTDIEGHQQAIRELGEGEGIHFVGPYDYIGFISTYKSLIEDGKILKASSIQKSAVKDAVTKLEEYLNTIKNLPKMY